MIPINKEHKEAEQAFADEGRDKFVSTLSLGDQKKFKAITKAVEILLEAGILFYLFPMLPSYAFRGKNQVWQWNSLMFATEFDSSDKPTEKSSEKNAIYHEAFFTFLFNLFINNFQGETLEQKLEYLPHFFSYCMRKHYALMTDIPFPTPDKD